jgi:hypothetical protein
MTNHESLLYKTTREFAEWLDANGQFDGSPWMSWFDENYCSKCESIKIKKENSKAVLGFELMFADETTCSYCELYKKCKYFQDKDETPTNVDIIEMWLKEPV